MLLSTWVLILVVTHKTRTSTVPENQMLSSPLFISFLFNIFFNEFDPRSNSHTIECVYCTVLVRRSLSVYNYESDDYLQLLHFHVAFTLHHCDLVERVAVSEFREPYAVHEHLNTIVTKSNDYVLQTLNSLPLFSC